MLGYLCFMKEEILKRLLKAEHITVNEMFILMENDNKVNVNYIPTPNILPYNPYPYNPYPVMYTAQKI